MAATISVSIPAFTVALKWARPSKEGGTELSLGVWSLDPDWLALNPALPLTGYGTLKKLRSFCSIVSSSVKRTNNNELL